MSLSGGSREPHLPVLTGANNFLMWQRRLKASLRSRQCWEVVTTKSEGPENDAAAGTLISTLDSHVLHLVSNDESAYDIWEELRTLYSKHSVQRQITTFHRLAGLKMKASDNATKFISKFRETTNQYVAAGGELPAEQQSMFLLHALGDVYKDIVSHFTLTENLDLEDIISATLAKADSSLEKGPASKVELALVAEQKKFCNYCKKMNHNISECFKLQNKKKQREG